MGNFTLPGNPRYQPKSLTDIFGYDNLAKTLVEVELAALKELGARGIISAEDLNLLTPKVEARLYAVTTSQMDIVEREVTKHDIRALVRLMQEIMPEPLRRWVHVPLTSYDVIETARALQFLRAHTEVVHPKATNVIALLRHQALKHADQIQIGRTHGQHALPVTVGFWFATVLNRVLFNLEQADQYADGLVGKISGAVGAYNAQVGLGITGGSESTFEEGVLNRLGLRPAPISTQILPPEPLAYYLHACLMLSASLGQFGRDGRHLMRTEIAELSEPFALGQVGSSTMAHKRNPISFENLEGTWQKNMAEYLKVLMTMISDQQRDLVGSSPSRDFPTLIVNLVSQLETLLRPDKHGVSFLEKITVDTESCRRNLARQGDSILAEPLYLALQMHGYEGDAHEIVNHSAMPMVQKGEAAGLYDAICRLAEGDAGLGEAWARVPADVHDLLRNPSRYVGLAERKTHEVCDYAQRFLYLNPPHEF